MRNDHRGICAFKQNSIKAPPVDCMCGTDVEVLDARCREICHPSGIKTTPFWLWVLLVIGLGYLLLYE